MKSVAAILGLLASLCIAVAPLQAQGLTYQIAFEAILDRISLPPGTTLLDDLPAGTKMTGDLSIYPEAKSGLFKKSWGDTRTALDVDFVLTLNGKLNVIFLRWYSLNRKWRDEAGERSDGLQFPG